MPGIYRPVQGSTREMQSSHAATAVDVAFDDPNLIADAGLVPPVVALAERIGLSELIFDHVSIGDAANRRVVARMRGTLHAREKRRHKSVTIPAWACPNRRSPYILPSSTPC